MQAAQHQKHNRADSERKRRHRERRSASAPPKKLLKAMERTPKSFLKYLHRKGQSISEINSVAAEIGDSVSKARQHAVRYQLIHGRGQLWKIDEASVDESVDEEER